MTKLATFLMKKQVSISLIVGFSLGASTAPLAHIAQDFQMPELSAAFSMEESLKEETAKPFWDEARDTENSFGFDLSEATETQIEPEAPPEITDEAVDQILSDYKGRINPHFKIPSLIHNQTKFWFRIYTEFDSQKKVIHHSLHPHIIFDVVDISPIMAQPAKASWLNTVKAEKAVAARVREIQTKLQKMALKKPEKMTEEELGWYKQLEQVKGQPRKIIQTAATSLRVQTGQKNFFQNGLMISNRYLKGMEAIFESHKLPVELTRLPFVESSFVIGATSKVGAAGIWQIMPGIGRKFVKVNDQIDERRNPWKATEVAAKLLKENHLILHKKWGLALTAYNHGPGGVRKAMKATGTKDIEKIVTSYRSGNFDFASANFYTCFLAALYAQTYSDLLWENQSFDLPLETDSIRLQKAYRPKEVLKLTGLTNEQVLLYNPELDRSFQRNLTIPAGYRIFLPVELKKNLGTVASLKRESSVKQKPQGEI